MYIYYPSNAAVYVRQVGGPDRVTEQWIGAGPDSVIIISGSYPPTASTAFITASYAIIYTTSMSLADSASWAGTSSYSLNAMGTPSASYALTSSFLIPYTTTTGSLSASFNPSSSISQGQLILWINPSSGSYFDNGGIIPSTQHGQNVRHLKDISGLGRNIKTYTGASSQTYKYGLVQNVGPNQNKIGLLMEISTAAGAYSAAFSTPTYPLWLFVVAKLAPGWALTVPVFDGIASNQRMGCWIGTTAQLYSGTNMNTPITGSITGSILNNWCLWSFKNTSGGNNSYIRTNGTQSVFGNCGTQTITGYTLGADYSLNGGGGLILDLLLYSNITDADALNIENWLKCRNELVY